MRILSLLTFLIGMNLLAWGWALVSFREYPVLIGTALLAWSFGLRHAVDADHIAAIDNVTRKLMQDGKKPIGVGLYFSLGHSTIVVLATIAVAATATAFKDRIEEFHSVGGIVGTSVSAVFQLLIALINIVILQRTYGWAFVKPIRKLYYNMTITGVSVIVALVVGGVEALGLIGAHFHLTGPVWDAIGAPNENLGNIGFLIIGIFVGTWLISFFIYRSRGYDYLEYQRSGD